MNKFNCLFCGKSFEYYTKNKIYCSTKCCNKAYDLKNKGVKSFRAKRFSKLKGFIYKQLKARYPEIFDRLKKEFNEELSEL